MAPDTSAPNPPPSSSNAKKNGRTRRRNAAKKRRAVAGQTAGIASSPAEGVSNGDGGAGEQFSSKFSIICRNGDEIIEVVDLDFLSSALEMFVYTFYNAFAQRKASFNIDDREWEILHVDDDGGDFDKENDFGSGPGPISRSLYAELIRLVVMYMAGETIQLASETSYRYDIVRREVLHHMIGMTDEECIQVRTVGNFTLYTKIITDTSADAAGPLENADKERANTQPDTGAAKSADADDDSRNVEVKPTENVSAVTDALSDVSLSGA
jgi:hypothetical protein